LRRALPARLDDARNLPHEGQLPEADAAKPEIPKESPRATVTDGGAASLFRGVAVLIVDAVWSLVSSL
jgi:hypothetical protein